MHQRDAVAQQLAELWRGRDRIREQGDECGQLVGRNDAAEVVEPVESERKSRRIRGLERKAVGERLVGEADAVVTLEHWPESAADRHVLGLDQADALILQRLEQPARAQ